MAYIAAFFAVGEKSVGTRMVLIFINCEVKLITITCAKNDCSHGDIKLIKSNAMLAFVFYPPGNKNGESGYAVQECDATGDAMKMCSRES